MTCLHCQQLEARCGQLHERIDRLTAVAEAARARMKAGCNDTCGKLLIESSDFHCECGHERLAAALSALDGQGEP